MYYLLCKQFNVKSEKIKIQVKQNDKSLTGIKFKAFVYRQLNWVESNGKEERRIMHFLETCEKEERRIIHLENSHENKNFVPQ